MPRPTHSLIEPLEPRRLLDAVQTGLEDQSIVLRDSPKAGVYLVTAESGLERNRFVYFGDLNAVASSSDLIVKIDWGDGNTSSGELWPHEEFTSISGEHTYADEGEYIVTLTIHRSAEQQPALRVQRELTIWNNPLPELDTRLLGFDDATMMDLVLAPASEQARMGFASAANSESSAPLPGDTATVPAPPMVAVANPPSLAPVVFEKAQTDEPIDQILERGLDELK